MKTKANQILLPLILLASIVLFNTCKKDCNPNNPPPGETADLSQIDKLEMFPYKDFDSIGFIRNSKDTLMFLTGRNEVGYNTAFNQDPQCPKLDNLQYKKLILTNNINGTITLYLHILPQSNDNDRQYSISFNDRTYGPSTTYSFIKDTNLIVYASGVPYRKLITLVGSITDSLYFLNNTGIIKFKYNNDIYEKFP